MIDPRNRRLAGLVVAARVPDDDTPDAAVIARTVFVPAEQIETVTSAGGVAITGRARDAARGPRVAERTLPAPRFLSTRGSAQVSGPMRAQYG